MDRFAKNLKPPYYAVLFTNQLGDDDRGYAQMADAMVKLAREEEGFLGIESTRDEDGLGITISYWRTEYDIRRWKQQSDHMAAQKLGIERWYDHYELRIAKVEHAYCGPNQRTAD